MKDKLKIVLVNIIITVLICTAFAVILIKEFNVQANENINNEITVSTVDSDIEDLYDNVVDGVVYIQTFVGMSEGSGSGFIYKIEEGYAYVLTNQHVVEGAQSIVVVTNQGEYVEDVVYLGGDSFYDVAVLKVKVTDDMKALKMKESDDYDVGEYAIAIGSPLGENFINTATLGIVSGKDRYVVVDQDNAIGLKLIQTDAALNPGNSGGPLFSMDGYVIGINTLKFKSYSVDGMGFSIPITSVLPKLEYFEKGESVRPSLGIMIQQTSEGPQVANVVQGSASENAGMEKGDIILSIAGEDVSNVNDIRRVLYDYIGGDELVIKLKREDEIIELNVKLDTY